MELLIKILLLLIVFQIAATNTNVMHRPRYQRDVNPLTRTATDFGYPTNEPLVLRLLKPRDSQQHFTFFPDEVPSHRFDIEPRQSEPFALPLNDGLAYAPGNDVQNRVEEAPEMAQNQTGAQANGFGNSKVPQGYSQAPLEQGKPSLLDNVIRNRVHTLQTFQEDFNRLLDDIGNLALSFVSKSSFFGGITRRSLFDPSNIDGIKSINADVSTVAGDFYRIYNNLLVDLSNAFNYVINGQSLDFRDLFTHGFSALLRFFTP